MTKNTIQEKWDFIMSELLETAEKCFGKEKKPVNKPWITKEAIDLMEERRMYKAKGDTEQYRMAQGTKLTV